jgi:hypothetical protein
MADPERSTEEPAAPLPPTDRGQAEPVASPADRTADAATAAPAVAVDRSAEPGAGPARTTEAAGGEPARSPEPAAETAGTPESEPADDRTRPYRAGEGAERADVDRPTEVMAAPASRPVEPVPPAAAPPREQNNRLVGTAWVLLASLVFEVVLTPAFALLVLIAAGPAAVPQNMTQFFGSPFAWLPVLLFFLFYELTVLLFHRGGRFLYVLASLVVGAIMYVLFAVLFLALQPGGISNEQALGRVLIEPQFILVGLVAREVMLWTGLAVGARGKRVRRRNRAARAEYKRAVAAQGDDRARAAG